MRVVLFIDPRNMPTGVFKLEVYKRAIKPGQEITYSHRPGGVPTENEYVVMRIKEAK